MSVDWIPATVPSTVAGILRTQKRWSLDDTPRRFDAEDWWFRTRFDQIETSNTGPMCLGFDGLATLAEIWINDKHVLNSDNMFLSHELSVSNLRPRDNELVICFRSLDSALTAKRARPRWRAPMIENQQLRWYRTTVLGRTPGWSPPAQAVGPWRDVWIDVPAPLQLEDAHLRTSVNGSIGYIDVTVELRGANIDSTCVLEITRTDSAHRIPLTRDGDGRFVGSASISNPERWWPHTHGDPALYRAGLAVSDKTGVSVARFELGNVAFRSIAIDVESGRFAIRINETDVFCRGACWTPIDPVQLHATKAEYVEVLEQVTRAGMNMVRVGGTMVYENDHFYDACDAMGILVWQDFMFANMDFPAADERFARSTTDEARQVLARLSEHPCIALLCGNSEVEQQAAMWGAARELWSPAFFHETLRALSQSMIPDVPYWPSSAHGGAFPHSGCAGTSSYYGVGAYLRPLNDARLSEMKFASECLAFANVPEQATLATMPGGLSVKVHHPVWKMRTPRDLGAGWDFDDVRDFYLKLLFNVDPLQLRYADHERYLELSRITSAEVMASTYCEWRRHRSTCGGALIWFLRDLWPGAGWGITGSDGVLKAAFHYLRRILQPRTLFFSDEGGNGLSMHLVNERADAWVGELIVSRYRHGEHRLSRSTKSVAVAARESVEYAAADWFDGFHDLTDAYRFGPSQADLIVATIASDEPAVSSNIACYFPRGLPALPMHDVGLHASARLEGDGRYRLRILTRAFAYAVYIDADGFESSDQYFHLEAGQAYDVHVRRTHNGKPRKLAGMVRALNSAAIATIQVDA